MSDPVTTVTSVGVAGSGTMGAGIAEVAALAGFPVTLRGRTPARAAAARATVERSLARQVARGTLTAEDSAEALGRVTATADLAELGGCDLVVESVVEDLAVKRELFGQLDRACPAETILATNTSTLPVTDVAVATARPDRVLGLHFFNPAPRMPLVEVVPALTTDQVTVEAGRRFAEQCGKRPVVVQDRAGFVVNALLFPYLNGAVRMLEDGTASRDDIDAAMKGGCGFPMGPLELLDLIGLDTGVAILEALDAGRDDGCCEPALLLEQLVAAGRLGRKSGAGFYDYQPAAVPTAAPAAPARSLAATAG